MATTPSIFDIDNTAIIRQYLLPPDDSFKSALMGGVRDPDRQLLIYTMSRCLEKNFAFTANSEDGSRQLANYVYWLVAPILVPVNLTLADQTINLTAMAVSTTEIDLQWTAVPNATQYVLERALDPLFTTGLGTVYVGPALSLKDNTPPLTPATHYYYRIHAEAPGFVNSPYAFADATTLSVVQPLQVDYYFGDTDYYATLQGGTDNVPYVGSLAINNNQPFTITWPSGAANNKWQVIRVPRSQNIKTTWVNTNFNFGTIPDSSYQAALQVVSLPNYTYYCTRSAISLFGLTLTEEFS